MKNLWVLVGVCLVVRLYDYDVQAHPHRSIEDTEEDTSSESEPSMSPVVPPVNPAPERESSNVREMTAHEKSHENDSSEEERNTSTSMTSLESQQNSDEDDSVKFPKTESLCPARPEEITLVEQECAKEYQQWKEMKARKEMTPTTTFAPQVMMVETVDVTPKPGQAVPPEEPMSEDMKMTSTEEPSTTEEVTSTEMATMTTTDDDMTTTTETDMTTEAATARATVTSATTTEEVEMREKRMVKRTIKRKRSCYPATCILRKLKLLDSMSQLNSKQIQKFAVNMTVDGSSNLEQKAMECVKEINDAMIDSSSDIGKKVGCVAYKVITCLNKGLACPIIKVPHN